MYNIVLNFGCCYYCTILIFLVAFNCTSAANNFVKNIFLWPLSVFSYFSSCIVPFATNFVTSTALAPAAPWINTYGLLVFCSESAEVPATEYRPAGVALRGNSATMKCELASVRRQLQRRGSVCPPRISPCRQPATDSKSLRHSGISFFKRCMLLHIVTQK